MSEKEKFVCGSRDARTRFLLCCELFGEKEAMRMLRLAQALRQEWCSWNGKAKSRRDC